jgi:hypothetical protein
MLIYITKIYNFYITWHYIVLIFSINFICNGIIFETGQADEHNWSKGIFVVTIIIFK